MTYKIKNICMKILICLLVLSFAFGLTILYGCGSDNQSVTKSIKVNESLFLKVDEVYLLEAKTQNITAELKWESNDSSIAVVDEQGLVTAKGVGRCEITVSANGKSAKCVVNVSLTDDYPELNVNTTQVGVIINESFSLESEFIYKSQPIEVEISYESQNQNVATVDENGVITGVSAGQTNVIVSVNYLTFYLEKVITVNVYDNVVFNLSNNKVNLSTYKVNGQGYDTAETVTFNCSANGQDVIDEIEIEWVVEDPEIATITGNGNSIVVNSVGVGQTKVRASFTYDQVEYSVFANINVVKAKVQEENKVFTEKINGNNQINLDIPEFLILDEINELKLNGTAAETINKDASNNTIVLEVQNGVSVYDIEVKSQKVDYLLTIVVVDKMFKQADVNRFAEIIESNLSGYYLFAEDLDFTGVTFQSIGGATETFNGHIDGCGYAIKNLTLTARTEKDQWGVYKTGAGNIVSSNAGVIENLFVQYVAPSVNAWVGFVGKNSGTVENVLVDIILGTNISGGYAQSNGAVVCANMSGGKVNNCIGSVNVGGNSRSQQYGTVIGTNYTATLSIVNCYGLLNGMTQVYEANGTGVVNSFTHADNVKPSVKDCANFNSSDEFIKSSVEFDSSNGWSEFWNKGNVTIAFGDEYIGFMDVGSIEYSKLNDEEEKGVIYDLSSVTDEQISSANFDGVALSVENINGSKVTVPYSVIGIKDSGTYNLKIVANGDVYNLNIVIIAAIFTQKDVANFASIISNNLSGVFKLGEDLDFTGVTFQSIGGATEMFTGHFDGCGYMIKNLTLTARTEKDQWGVYKTGAGNVISNNYGIIENLAIQFTAPNVNAWVGFVGNNNGVIRNVYVDITLGANFSGGYAQCNGAVASRNNTGGTVKNCISSVHVGEYSQSQQFGTIVGANYTGVQCIENCYGILNELKPVYEANGASVVNYHSHVDHGKTAVKDCANYATANDLIASVKALSLEKGWSNYWSIADGILKFGDERIKSKIPVVPSDDCETGVDFTDIWGGLLG